MPSNDSSRPGSAPQQAPRPRNTLGVLQQLDGASVGVHQLRCVEVRNRNAGCHACADACAGGAIAVVDGLLSVDASRCIGCGTCATVCPTAALEALQPSDDELLAQAAAALQANGGATCVIACTEALDAAFGFYDPGRVVEVRCLGRVDESLLAALARCGAERVVLVGRACASCEHAAGARVARRVADTACALLEAWSAPIEVEIADELPAEVRCARWSCLDEKTVRPVRGSEAPTVPADAAGAPDSAASPDAAAPSDPQVDPTALRPCKVGPDGTLAHHRPTRRSRLRASLDALGAPAEVTLSTRLWATVSVDATACSSCRMCAVFCPTGALRKFDDRAAGTFGIEHVPADCVACGCCRDVCPKHAVTLVEEVFAPDLVDGHAERFEMRPPEIATGKPTTVVNKLRKILGANQVNFA